MPNPDWVLGGSTWGFFVGDDRSDRASRLEAVRAIIDLGLGVEVWPTREFSDSDPSPTEIEQIREACAAAPFVSVHIRSRYWHWNPGELREEIGLAASIGASTLVVHPICFGLVGPGDRFDAGEIARVAADGVVVGVRIALENVRNSIWALDRVLDAIGDDPEETNVGICVDVGHALLSSDAGDRPVRTYLERYHSALVHLHLHDNGGVDDDHLVPGEGVLEWSRLVETLSELEYVGSAALEVQRSDGDAVCAIDYGVRFFRALSASGAKYDS